MAQGKIIGFGAGDDLGFPLSFFFCHITPFFWEKKILCDTLRDSPGELMFCVITLIARKQPRETKKAKFWKQKAKR